MTIAVLKHLFQKLLPVKKTQASLFTVQEDRSGSSPSSHTSAASSSSSISSTSSGWLEEDLLRLFSQYDCNGDGKISADELEAMVRALGNIMMTEPDGSHSDFKAEAAIMMEVADLDGDGFIDFLEFATCIAPKAPPASDEGWHPSPDEEEDLKLAFTVYDQNRDGVITAEELHHVLQRVIPGIDGCGKTLADCRNMITAVDKDGDGTVCFGEFAAMMRVTTAIC